MAVTGSISNQQLQAHRCTPPCTRLARDVLIASFRPSSHTTKEDVKSGRALQLPSVACDRRTIASAGLQILDVDPDPSGPRAFETLPKEFLDIPRRKNQDGLLKRLAVTGVPFCERLVGEPAEPGEFRKLFSSEFWAVSGGLHCEHRQPLRLPPGRCGPRPCSHGGGGSDDGGRS